jgi:hypothetical protein
MEVYPNARAMTLNTIDAKNIDSVLENIKNREELSSPKSLRFPGLPARGVSTAAMKYGLFGLLFAQLVYLLVCQTSGHDTTR